VGRGCVEGEYDGREGEEVKRVGEWGRVGESEGVEDGKKGEVRGADGGGGAGEGV